MGETDLLLASQNPGKLAEMKELVAGLPFRVLSPADLGIRDAPEETGTAFIENAVLKARHYARRAPVAGAPCSGDPVPTGTLP